MGDRGFCACGHHADGHAIGRCYGDSKNGRGRCRCSCFRPADPPVEDAATAPATKRDDGKDRWDLLPIGSVRAIVRVLTWSVSETNPNRYPEGNWQRVERPRERYYAAAMRHLTAWWDGEQNDPDSGMPHLAHAVCSMLFLLWFEAKS